MGTKQVSTPAVVLDFGTLSRVCTSTTSFSEAQILPVYPFSQIRLDTAASVGAVDVTITASIDGGTAYDDTITTVAAQQSTSASNSKTISSALYTHIKLISRISTSSTSADGEMATKYIAK